MGSVSADTAPEAVVALTLVVMGAFRKVASAAFSLVAFLYPKLVHAPPRRWAEGERASGLPAGLAKSAGDLQLAADTVRVDAKHAPDPSANGKAQ